MEGSVPTRADADKFVAKAAEVIGADNVIDNYVIDPAAPPASDGFIRVDEPFLFRTDSATIDPAYTPVLNLGVLVMKLNPHARMVVTGHTDTVGVEEYNKDLSERRARAVAEWISTNGQIPMDRFDLIGAGSSVPIGSNDTAEGRAANRRIEVVLTGLLSD
jgi:OOP family OmpA-OmpF porin